MGELDLLRVDHIGSFRRPEPLLDMHTRFDNGDATPEEMAALEGELIREVIAHQERTGFPIVTDGEFRRRNFQDSFGAAVSGYDTPESREEYRRACRESGFPVGGRHELLSVALAGSAPDLLASAHDPTGPRAQGGGRTEFGARRVGAGREGAALPACGRQETQRGRFSRMLSRRFRVGGGSAGRRRRTHLRCGPGVPRRAGRPCCDEHRSPPS